MSESLSLKVFKCPSCGGPLDPEKGAASMKCPYCGATSIIPESLRTPAYTSLSDVTRLAKEGKLDEAARVYSKITGLKHEYAMESVKSMAGIRDEKPAPQSQPGRFEQPQASPSPIPQSYSIPMPSQNRRNISCLSVVVRLAIFIGILSTVLPALGLALKFKLPSFLQENSIVPVPFADEVMSFKPSSTKDPRAIGVDANGNILLFNYNSSDVQIFDPAGNETSLLVIRESDGRELNNDSMAVRSDGTIYIKGSRGILVFNQNGERLGEIINNDDLFIIYSITIGADDKLYALSNTGIVRLNEKGEVDLKITEETIEVVSGESPGIGAMGVDAQGNIYFSGDFNSDVLKFSPTGEFINSFSWDFNSVRQIAFDNYGRIYVVDFFDVKVFNPDYSYIDQIEGAYWGVDFDAQNYMYGISTQGDQVVKFAVKSPDGQ